MKKEKLIKKVVEVSLDDEGNEVEKVLSIDTAIIDGENQVGTVNSGNWNGNWNVNNMIEDVETIHNTIVETLLK